MNILYYIPFLEQKSGGIRQYATGFLKILGKINKHKVYVLNNNEDPEVMNLIVTFDNLVHISPDIGKERKWEKGIYDITKALNFVLKKGFSKNFKCYSFLDRICRKFDIDLVHSPFQNQPFPRNTKNIFTLHDVQELHFPEYFTPEEREARARNWLYKLKNTDRIVVSYDHIKKDIVEYFDYPEEKIHVILLNMGNLWFTNYQIDDISNITRVRDFDKFLLYPANTWQHKNHLRLLDAISLLRDEYSINVNIVCTGHQNEHFKNIETHLKELNLTSQIKFLGVVNERMLYDLYQQCTGVVIPTIYEAGSFPLMESILMEVPVICSNVTSLPKTIGNKQFTFDPFETRGMAEKIKQIWSSRDFRKKNIQNSKMMSDNLLETNSSEQIKELYNKI